MYQRVSSTLKINIKKFLSNNDIEVTILGQNIATIKKKKKRRALCHMRLQIRLFYAILWVSDCLSETFFSLRLYQINPNYLTCWLLL